MRKITGFIYLKMIDLNIHLYYYLNLLKIEINLSIANFRNFFSGNKLSLNKIFCYWSKVFLSSAIIFIFKGQIVIVTAF